MKRGLLAGVLVLLLTAAPAAAHVRSTTGYSEISRRDGVVAYRLSLESDLLAAAAGHGPPDAYVLPRVEVAIDGAGCEGSLTGTDRERRDGRDYAVLDLAYECPGPADGAYTVVYSVFADNGFVDDHANITRFDLPGAHGTWVFDAGHHELDAGAAGSATRFVGLGVEHILSGLDHVLFLIAVLLGAQGLRQVITLATAFTGAHSVTLALGALGWVHVPPEIVEPLIALSIAYVAAENVLGGASRHRLAVVFGFGLLHGLGFASSLTWSGGLDLSALMTFNAGIELGQALIVLALFPALLLIRGYGWSPLAHGAAGTCAAAVGLFWFAERLMA